MPNERSSTYGSQDEWSPPHSGPPDIGNGYEKPSTIKEAEDHYSESIQLPTHPTYTRGDYGMFAILVFINLLNYTDRYTIAAVLSDIQEFYGISDSTGGLIQTVFIATFVVFSPLCGYLGDRYNRKWVMVVGIAIWLLAVFTSTFIPKIVFPAFMALRAIVGIGEASYAVICPSLIADMFTGTKRSRMLMIFYFAIPVGSGLGYIVGAVMLGLTGQWQWGMRVTAVAGVICLILIIVFVRDRPRGQMEIENLEEFQSREKNYFKDIWALMCNATFVTSTLGYTAVVFVTGTLAWWAPTAIEHAQAWEENLNSTELLPHTTKTVVTLKFGVITTLSGLVGVSVGTFGSNFLKAGKWCLHRVKTERSDAIMCAIGTVIAVPTLFGVIQLIPHHLVFAFICMFFAITGLCFNWATNVDMLMAVVIPARRSSANAVQILTSHLLGDGSGPYVLGLISDAIRKSQYNNAETPEAHCMSLLTSFYVPNVILVLSFFLYVAAAFTFPRDRRRFHEELGQFDKKHGRQNVGYHNEEEEGTKM